MRWLYVILMLVFSGTCKADYGAFTPEKPNETSQIEEHKKPIEKTYISLRPLPVSFISEFDRYQQPLPNFTIEYAGLRGLLYRQIESASRKFIRKQLRVAQDSIGDSFAYEDSLREDFFGPHGTSFSPQVRVVGSRHKIAQLGKVEIWNDGKLKWDKDSEDIGAALGSALGDIGLSLPEFQSPNVKVQFKVRASIKLDNIENSEAGASVRFMLPWKVKLLLQAAARPSGYAEASFQLLLWQL